MSTFTPFTRHPSIRYLTITLLPLFAAFSLLLFAAARPARYLFPDLPGWKLLLVWAGGGLLFLLEGIRRYFDDAYVFDESAVMRFAGRLSLTCYKMRIVYRDIRDVAVTQTVLGRLLNFGNVELDTAATDQLEVEVVGVANPHQLMNHIQERRAAWKREHGGQDTGKFEVD